MVLVRPQTPIWNILPTSELAAIASFLLVHFHDGKLPQLSEKMIKPIYPRIFQVIRVENKIATSSLQ